MEAEVISLALTGPASPVTSPIPKTRTRTRIDTPFLMRIFLSNRDGILSARRIHQRALRAFHASASRLISYSHQLLGGMHLIVPKFKPRDRESLACRS